MNLSNSSILGFQTLGISENHRVVFDKKDAIARERSR
jgi:hypothetical protein